MEAGRLKLLLSAGSALLAASMAWLYLQGRENELLRRGRMLKVVAADRYLSAYTRLKARDLRIIEMPAEYVAKGVLLQPKDAVDQLALVAFNEGEPLSYSKLSLGSAALAYSVPEGKRALTLPVDRVTGLSGMLRPGDLVDLIYLDEPGKPGATASLLLQGAQVLAAGTLVSLQQEKGDATGSVTLALDPPDCQLVMLALNRGALHLALRPPGDTRLLPSSPAGPEELAARARRRAAQPADFGADGPGLIPRKR